MVSICEMAPDAVSAKKRIDTQFDPEADTCEEHEELHE